MSVHEGFSRREDVEGSSNRSFGLVIAAVLLIIGLWPILEGHAVRWWAVVPAGLLVVVALARPRLLAPFNRLWTRLGMLIHWLVNPVVTGLIFFAAVVPTGFILRLLRRDPLRLRLDAEAKSYWIERRPPGPAPETMSNQF